MINWEYCIFESFWYFLCSLKIFLRFYIGLIINLFFSYFSIIEELKYIKIVYFVVIYVKINILINIFVIKFKVDWIFFGIV